MTSSALGSASEPVQRERPKARFRPHRASEQDTCAGQRQPPLGLVGGRRQHAQPHGRGPLPRPPQQQRLADPGFALDQHRAAVSRDGRREQLVEPGELGFALDHTARR